MDYHYEDFTEANYRRLLRRAAGKWRFVRYEGCREEGTICLWRHDVDFSLHRALKLARIEQEEGLATTYFIHLHSEFYNPFETGNMKIISAISDMGHRVGLHFDPTSCASDLTMENATQVMCLERDILQKLFQVAVTAFSVHIPETCLRDVLALDELGGMVNACGPYIVGRFKYCSDSNGYWRFSRLSDVLESDVPRLHVLTHPEMWVPEPMSPRERVMRCINGRAAKTAARYDKLLAGMNRTNI